MKKFSKRKFVYCSLQEAEIPVEHGDGCCEFFNEANHKCEYEKYSHDSRIKRLSEREEIYKAFSQRDEDEDY